MIGLDAGTLAAAQDIAAAALPKTVLNAPADIGGIDGLTLTGLGTWVNAALGSGALIYWLRTRPAMRKLANEAEERSRQLANDEDVSLRAVLLGRIDKLEASAIEERRACDVKLTAMQAKLDQMQEKVDGLIRQLLQYQVTTGQALPISMRSPSIDHALDKLAEIERERGA